MSHLTLQEVVDRINHDKIDQAHSFASNRRTAEDQATDDQAMDHKHRPEISIPRITRRLARFMFSN
jgi:hypothetical protein